MLLRAVPPGGEQPPDVRGAMADARAALRLPDRPRRELRIDPDRIVVGGGSAGGHLAAALGSGLPLADGATAATRRRSRSFSTTRCWISAPGTAGPSPGQGLLAGRLAASPHRQRRAAVADPGGNAGPGATRANRASVLCGNAGGRWTLRDSAVRGTGARFLTTIPTIRSKTNQRILEFLRNLQGQLV